MITTETVQVSSITLQEFESCMVALSAEAYRVLRSRYAGRIDAAVTEQPGVYLITARDYVGRVGLPGGVLLVIKPKVGAANLFYMLASGAKLIRFYPPPTGLTPDPEIFSFIMALLVSRVEDLLRKGFYRAFVPREDDLPFVRGRIMLDAQLRRYGERRDRHICAYADLTADIIENRVVAATLRLLPSLLDPKTERELVRRVRYLLPRFEGIKVVTAGEALALLPHIAYHRLNRDYAPLMALCLLALQRLTLDERAGTHPFASFLVDMPRLFEQFITERLRAGLPQYGLRVTAQRSDYLDESKQVGIRPDVLVYKTGSATPALVLDIKYKLLNDQQDLNRDLYQVSAYMDRYGLTKGVLVYPQFGEATPTHLKLRGTPKSLHLATLDLTAHDPAELERNCAALSEQVAHLCDAAPS